MNESFLTYYVEDMSSDRIEYTNFVDAVRKIVSATQPYIMTLIYVTYPRKQNEQGTSLMVSRLLQTLPLDVKYRVQDFDNLKPVGVNFVQIRPRFFNVIFLNNYQEFMKELLPHFQKNVFDHRGFYIVVLPDTTKWHPKDIQHLMEAFWRLYVVNLNILLQDVEGAILSMTYFPFGAGYCEKVKPVVWNKYINGNFTSLNHFPRKLRNFYGCPLLVGATNGAPFLEYVNETFVSGIEGIILRTLSNSVLNFTSKFIQTDRTERQGIIYPNGTISGGGLAMLRDRKVNFTIGFYGIRADYLQKFDLTVAIYATKLQFFATIEGTRQNSVEYIWMAFQNNVWLCIGVSLSIGFVVIWILQIRSKVEKDFVIGNNIDSPTLNMVAITFGNPVNQLPEKNFARTLVTLFFLFTYVLRTGFLGSLYEVAQRETEYVTSFQEMLDQNFTFYAAGITKYYIDSVDALKGRVKYAVPNENTFNRVTEATLVPGSKETALTSQYVIYHLNRMGKRKHLLKPIKDDLALATLGICLQKQSLLTRIFNDYILQFSAHGLTSFSMKAYYPRDYLTNVKNAHEPKQTTLSDVWGIFQLLIFGWIVSTIAFVAEIIYLKFVTRVKIEIVD
ncbi:uncharacterized protein LOC134829192 [Culicoides brevitarsis]|uniref:uncharacterized protein LOC134829192 n=1 Tax=Culicoides brevitarsis TaxID=469753 RepID=UPI00307B381C